MSDNDSCCLPPDGVLEFPCDITVKAMGRASDDLREVVFAIVQKHVAELCIDAVTVKASSGGKFHSVNVRFTASARTQLEAIYLDFHNHDQILMTL